MYKLFIINSFILLTIILGGCKGCNPINDLNNGNSNPEKLILEIYGSSINEIVEWNFGFGCNLPDDFVANVKITVRTASSDENGNVTLDPNPYYEIEDEFNFWKNTGFNEGTLINVRVPSRGAYGVFGEITYKNCHNCCAGDFSAQQCGNRIYNTQSMQFICNMGKPRVAFERIFYSETRPEPNFNLQIQDYIMVRACAFCQSCGTAPCI